MVNIQFMKMFSHYLHSTKYSLDFSLLLPPALQTASSGALSSCCYCLIFTLLFLVSSNVRCSNYLLAFYEFIYVELIRINHNQRDCSSYLKELVENEISTGEYLDFDITEENNY